MFRHIKSLSTSRPPVINFSKRRSSNQGCGPAMVLRSTSQNIYKNLALEDWFYQNHNFEENKILLFYKNSPCVVIGRHQNPWTEANIPYLRKNSIKIGWFYTTPHPPNVVQISANEDMFFAAGKDQTPRSLILACKCPVC